MSQALENKKKSLIALKKANTMIGKIIKMVDDNEYCIDIMQQNLATIGLLKSVHEKLMEGHLNSCVKNALASKNENLKQKMIDEIIKVSKYNK